jgi:hypothetical protein
MLPVAVEAVGLHVDGKLEAELVEERLVLEHGGEAFLEPSDALCRLSPHHDPAGARRPCHPGQIAADQVWWRDHRLGRHSQLPGVVQRGVFGAPGPAVPVDGGSVDHRRLRVSVEEGRLALQLLGQVDVVGVEEGDELAFGRLEAEVARGAHSPVLAARVLQQPDAVGILGDELASHIRAPVGRAVVHEQELPALEGLVGDALDGLGDELFRVEEDHDHRHSRTHRTSSHRDSDFSNVAGSASRT